VQIGPSVGTPGNRRVEARGANGGNDARDEPDGDSLAGARGERVMAVDTVNAAF
jgi:hypothetical protein